MNPEASSLVKAAKDLGINLKAADSSIEYGFYGKINKKEALKIIKKNKFKSIDAGYIKKRIRQVVIKPNNIIFKSETLDLR